MEARERPISINDLVFGRLLQRHSNRQGQAVSEVWQATLKGSQVAVKVASKSTITTESHGIVREATVLMSLRDDPDAKYIVRAIGVASDSLNAYFIMEYADGGDLYNFAMGSDLTAAQVKSIFAQLALALDFLHKRNVIHRDVKLDNVLITRDGYLKLADFGFATMDATASGGFGTPSYTAPEILTPRVYKSYTSKVDVWSLGVLMFTLVSKEYPFGKGLSIISLVAGADSSPDYSKLVGTSKSLAALVALMLTWDPDVRPTISSAMSHEYFAFYNFAQDIAPVAGEARGLHPASSEADGRSGQATGSHHEIPLEAHDNASTKDPMQQHDSWDDITVNPDGTLDCAIGMIGCIEDTLDSFAQ